MTGTLDSTAPTWAYDVILTRRNDRFYARIPELNLVAEGEDAASAHAALDADRQKLVDRHLALGLPVPPPRDVRIRRDFVERILPFLVKAAAVAVVGSFLVIAIAVAINYALRDPLRHAAQKTARAAVAQITAGLEDFARRDLTPDREERLRKALRGAVPVLRPFLEEVQPLFPRDGAPAQGAAGR